MGILSNLKAAMFGPAQSVAQSDNWLIRAIGGGRTQAGVPVSQYTAMQFPVVYSAVGIIADTIAQLPLKVMRRTEAGSVAATNHPLYQLLHDDPNEHMTSFTWRNTTQSHALLWGNGYSEIERNGAGEAVGLWPLLPDRTAPQKSGAALRYRTTIDTAVHVLPAEDVLHIPALGFDGYLGYSPIAMARQAIGLGLAMEEFGSKFFSNDAKSGGFLMHPGRLSAGAQQNLSAAKTGRGSDTQRTDPGIALERQGGLDNAHRVKVLEEGMKFISTTIPPEDAQFLSSREFQIAEISRIYRVPLILLSSHEKTTSWGSGIEQLMIGFVVWTIQPWIARWEQELNRKLFTTDERKDGLFVKFNVNGLLRGDMTARAAFYNAGMAGQWLVPNDARDMEDLNHVSWGDTPVVMQGQSATSRVPSEGLRE